MKAKVQPIALGQFVCLLLIAPLSTLAAEPPPDLSEYKTTATAQPLSLDALRRVETGRMGFLGVETEAADGKLVVRGVAPDSPAYKVGVKSNDIIVRVGNQPVASPEVFRALIQSNGPGRFTELGLLRDGQPLELIARLGSVGSVGRPMDRIRLGIRMGGVRPAGGTRVEEVDEDSRAARAGVKAGDYILKIDGRAVDGDVKVADIVTDIAPGETVKLAIARGDKELEIPVALAGGDGPDRPPPAGRRGGGFGVRGGPVGRAGRQTNDVLRVAIVGIEYPDVKHNPKIGNHDWENAFFSNGSYVTTNATGQRVYGSINDYYSEQSVGKMRVEGKMFNWIQVSSNRMDYVPSASTRAGGRADRGPAPEDGGEYTRDGPLLRETLDKLFARDGRDVLDRFDAVVFLYAGSVAARVQTNVYWPHSAGINHQNRRIRYVISLEGGSRMEDISILCHELGHIVGLPDLYIRRLPNSSGTNSTAASRPNPFLSRTQNPYAESLANWDLMALQVTGGRPQHFSAWSKEQLGWLKPTVIDPRVKQKLVLAPVEKSTNECFKILLRADASEYLLLENRRRIGFDQSAPGEGLLIWRVVYGRPVLEEAHGLSGPNAARSDVRHIPFPTDRNTAFTPVSKPSSAAFTGDELPVYLTNIRRLTDGRITFWVGYGYD